MRVAIRVDASALIGSGHVARMLTFAQGLREAGDDVSFLVRARRDRLAQNLFHSWTGDVCWLPVVEDSHFTPTSEYERWLGVPISQDADDTLAILRELPRQDWLVVDHYGLDAQWEQRLRSDVDRLMVVDDLANRRHTCDLLVDQNYHADGKSRYADLVDPKTRQLLGPEWAFLRSEFFPSVLPSVRSSGLRRILIFFGGVDAVDMTGRAVRSLLELSDKTSLDVRVIVGLGYEHRKSLEESIAQHPSIRLEGPTDRMAELMLWADLAIGSAGTTSWERALVRLPSIVIPIANNQRGIADGLAASGSSVNLGWHEAVRDGDICDTVGGLLANPNQLHDMSEATDSLFPARPEPNGRRLRSILAIDGELRQRGIEYESL